MDPAHSGTEASYRNAGLTAETAYHHRLRALNDDVAGEWSGPASAMTQATPNRPAAGHAGHHGNGPSGSNPYSGYVRYRRPGRAAKRNFQLPVAGDDAEIAGVTSSTYTLADADEDKPIQVLRCGRHASRSPPILMTADHPVPPNGGLIIAPAFK